MNQKYSGNNEHSKPSKDRELPRHNNDEGKGKKDFGIDWHKKEKGQQDKVV